MLPIAQYPDITPPTVQVTAIYPGANAKVVADSVAAPIEQQVNGVERMLYMSSQCTNDGSYTLTVTFELGTDLNMAQVLVQNRVSLAMPQLPSEVQVQGVNTKKKSPSILLVVNLYFARRPLRRPLPEQLRHDSDQGRAAAHRRAWATSPTSASATTACASGSIRDKMAARNLTTDDVVNAVQSQNVQVAAGQIGQQPVPTGQQFQFTMSTLGRLMTPSSSANIIVKTGEGGDSEGSHRRQSSACKDVARVELGAQQYDQICHAGRAAVGRRWPSFSCPAPTPWTSPRSSGQKMEELKKRFPPASIQDRLRHDAVHRGVDRRSLQNAARSRHSRRHRRAVLPAGLEGDDPADDRRAGVADRHVRRHGRCSDSR